MSHLTITLLGDAQFQLDDKPLLIKRNGVLALLIYLAVEQTAQPRGTVAGILWPDSSEKEARNNLRQLLHHVRKLPIKLVESTRQTLSFTTSAETSVDVLQVKNALETESFADAIAHYAGAFLGETVIWDSPLFNDWVLFKREQLHRQVMSAYGELIESAENAQDWPRIQQLASQQLALDSWREATHRSLMKALAMQGQRAAALAQYEQCRTILAEAFGVDPSQETQALHTQLLRDETLAPAQPRKLQLPSGSLIGRRDFLATALEHLQDRSRRLITIVGAGGMGKTRLALSIAEQVQAAGRPVCWVDLAGISADAPNPLPTAIADALGLTLQLKPDPTTQLIGALCKQPFLLILDNMEHLLPHTDLLLEIVGACAETQLLITSRERLNVRGEWLITLAGLPIDEAEALFIDVARQIGVSLRQAEQRATVREICQQVGGMPLAIELCARWLRVLEVDEIAAELQAGTGILTTTARDVPERHRTLSEIFDWSWRRLDSAEKKSLTELAVFQAGFDRQAARVVTGATIWTLESLIERSLLRRDGRRYHFHPVVRQFGLEKLGDGLAQASAAFAQFYAEKIRRTPEDAFKGGIADLVKAWRPELPNIHNTWRWLIEQEQYDQLGVIHDRIYDFYQARSRFQDVVDWYDWTLARVGENAQVDPALRARMYRARAFIRSQIGRFDDAQQDAQRNFAIASQHDLPSHRGMALQMMGIIAEMRGQPQASRDYLLRAYNILRDLDNLYHVQVVVNSLGITEYTLGNYAAAEKYLREALALAHKNELPVSQAFYHANLGNTLLEAGQSDDALDHFEQALAIDRELQRPRGIAINTRSIGETYLRLGETEKGLQYALEALQLDRDNDQQWNLGYGLWVLGEAYLQCGELESAEKALREALAHTPTTNDHGAAAASMATLGKIAFQRDDIAMATRYLSFALAFEGIYAFQRDDFNAVLATIKSSTPANLWEAHIWSTPVDETTLFDHITTLTENHSRLHVQA